MSKMIISAFADEIDPMLDVQMKVLKENDIAYIEVRGVNGKNITEYAISEVEDIKKQLDANGIKVSAVGSPIGKIHITDSFEEHFELFKHTVAIAEAFDTKYIRMFSFRMSDDSDKASYRDEVLSRLKKMLSYIEGKNIVLLHENEKGIYGDTAERCKDILTTLNSPQLRATFDPANFVQCGVETYPHAYNMLEDDIEYMHIKDAFMETKEVVPSGSGDGHVKEIIMELEKKGFEGFLSLEPHLSNFVGFSELEKQEIQEAEEGKGVKTFVIASDALKAILKEVV